MTPEQTVANIIVRFIREGGTAPLSAAPQLARKAVEAISAAELLIVPAARLARLLAVERAARALLGSEEAMAAALAGDEERAAMFDPWPEADALVAALVEVAA